MNNHHEHGSTFRQRTSVAVLAGITTGSLLLTGCATPAAPPSSAPAPSPAAVTTTAEARTPTATRARLTEAGRSVLRTGATAFVGTLHSGRCETSVALGVADRATDRRARVGHAFQMGSTTKTVTATVALQLVGEGRLSLDDTVERWLPGVVPGGHRITVRMLLQHTSGLFDYTADETFTRALLAEPRRSHTPQELLDVALAHEPTFAPGEGWAYSNTGFVLVGMILAQVTGKDIGTLITQRVIRPLGLRHTYWPDDTPFRGGHLHGYYRTEPGGSEYVDVSAFPVSWAGAAGALISTVGDLGTFQRALQSGELLEPVQLAQMRRTVDIPGTDGQYAYGLGLMRITTPTGYVWGHTGGTLGYLTQAWASQDGTRSLVENVPTGAATPTGPDSTIEQAASAAASSLFDTLTDP